MYLTPKICQKAVQNISQFPAVWIYYLWCQLNKANGLLKSGYSCCAVLVEISQMLPAQYKVNLQRLLQMTVGWVNMTLERIAAVSVLASRFRTKVSIYQCRKQIKPKWGRSNNEHFTQCAERVHYIILLSNLPLRNLKRKAIKGHLAHVVRILLYPASSHQTARSRNTFYQWVIL